MVALSLAVHVGLVLSISAAGASSLPREDPAWLGCWQSVSEGQTLWFEGDRCGWIRDGEPSFYRADHAADGARLERWAHFTELELRVEGETLFVQGPDGEFELSRIAQVPRMLRVEPYELPAGVEIDAETAASLLGDLRERRQEDQRVRAPYAAGRTPEDPGEMLRVDTDNTEFLRSLIQELGWIDATRFGSEASDAAFLLVQHSSDLRLMRTALPLIEADVEAGKLGGQAFALLHDRFQLNLGYLQRYGSQIGGLADGTSVLMPCEDPDGVDARRAAMGMGPLAEYLEHFVGDDGTPVRRLDDVSGAR